MVVVIATHAHHLDVSLRGTPRLERVGERRHASGPGVEEVTEHDQAAGGCTGQNSLQAREIRHVMLEGGPRLVAAFVRAGLVDAVRWYVAPALLGSGPAALGDAGMSTITDALRLQVAGVSLVGGDVRIDARVLRAEEG